jgi:(p)ppGpp synthase/HD superfamily hydrolase
MTFEETTPKKFTARFENALVYAGRLHADQLRKGSGVPYISHLLAVTALVIEDGGDEDEAIAALLHDAVEDQGGRKTLAEIRRRFGDRVAYIVEGLTDAYTIPKPPWRERKEKYIQHLRQATPDVRRVSLADKLHNARSILNNLRWQGEAIWERFNGGKEGTLWYYRALLDVFQERESKGMAYEFARVVHEIEQLVAGSENAGVDRD